ncbi:MAG: hypothetical protein PHY12_10705, partial [Eubacteriales bacterium]|nr:hypothetical protein [Eubacteriales bacterium]
MAKRMPVFMQRESLSRLGVALLLAAGYALPLLMAFGLESQLASAGLLMAGLLAVLTMLTATRKARWVLWGLTAALCGAQVFLPNAGLLGGCMDAVKALALYFQGTTAALALFGAQAALLIAAATALMGFLFARRGVGFLPAALVTVLMLFALWSLGKANLFWWAAPALVGLLLLQAQNAHEKINLLHVLPMALAAVLAAFLLLPQGNIALEPVHTQAMDLKQRIEDYLF